MGIQYSGAIRIPSGGFFIGSAEEIILPDLNPHRYWRVNATGQSQSPGFPYSVIYNEIEMFVSTDGSGPDLTSTVFAIASVADTPASNAFDNDLDSYWQSDSDGQPTFDWIGQDFGAGNLQNINSVSITKYAGSNSNYFPSTFDIQYSDDGITWVTKWSGSNEAVSPLLTVMP